MSCTPITPAMRRLLEQLTDYPNVDIEPLQGLSEWEQARAWGWVMPSGELTGAGLRHLHDLPRGLLKD